LRQLHPSVAIRASQHRDVAPDTLEPDQAIHRSSFDRRLALQLEAEVDEEGDRSLEVVADYADFVHPNDQGDSPSTARWPVGPRCPRDGAGATISTSEGY